MFYKLNIFYQKSFSENSSNFQLVMKLRQTHLKLIDAVNLINRNISPLLFFSFGLTFVMLCVSVFAFFLFTLPFFFLFPWFAISNTILNSHIFLVMLKVLLICHSTSKKETQVIMLLCQMTFNTNEKHRRNKVSLTLTT